MLLLSSWIGRELPTQRLNLGGERPHLLPHREHLLLERRELLGTQNPRRHKNPEEHGSEDRKDTDDRDCHDYEVEVRERVDPDDPGYDAELDRDKTQDQ